MSLSERAELIRDETQVGANTADRVGGLLVDMVSALGDTIPEGMRMLWPENLVIPEGWYDTNLDPIQGNRIIQNIPLSFSVPSTSITIVDITQNSFSARFAPVIDLVHNPYDVVYKLFTGFNESDVDDKIAEDDHAQERIGSAVGYQALGASVSEYGGAGETVVMLVKTRHIPSARVIYFSHGNINYSDPSIQAIGMQGDKIRVSSGGEGMNTTLTYPDNEWMILSVRFASGGDSTVHINGTLARTGTSGFNPQAVARDFVSISGRRPIPQMAEIELAYEVHFDGFLSNADREQAENKIATDFDIPGFSSETDLPEPGHLIFDCREGVTVSSGQATAWQSQGVDDAVLEPYMDEGPSNANNIGLPFKPPVPSENELNGVTPIHFNKLRYFHLVNLSPGELVGGKIVASNASEDTIVYNYFEEQTEDIQDEPEQTSIESVSEDSDYVLVKFFPAEFADGYEIQLTEFDETLIGVIDVGIPFAEKPDEINDEICWIEGEHIVGSVSKAIHSIEEQTAYGFRVRGYNENPGPYSLRQEYTTGSFGATSEFVSFNTIEE